MSVLCLCYLSPIQALAKNADYGPEKDPKISAAPVNISLTCPAPISVDCDDNGIYTTFAEFEAAGGSVSIPDGCEVDSFTFVADVEISQNGCSFVYMREYFISETCGNTFTCNQIIMLTDDDDPVIVNCPSDTTLVVSTAPCTVDFTVPDVETTDGCSAVTVMNDSPGTFPVGMTTVTYTATDDCGNSSQCSFVVTVETDNMLTLTCPPAIIDSTVCDESEVLPYADFAAFEAAGGSVSGDCNTMGTMYSIDNVNDVVIGGSCPKTVNRTYTISDEFGNEATCTQMLTLVDTMMPTFTVPADAIGVDCASALDTSVTGSPTNVMDNCDSNPVVTFVDTLLAPGMCEGEHPFHRIWTVTDACGNARSIAQLIEPVDNTPPTAICQDTVTVYLDGAGTANIDAADLDNGSSDSCSDVTLTAGMTFASCNQVNSPVPVTLDVADACGNMSSCDVIVVVLDTMAIDLTSPENDTVACLANVDPVFASIDDFELLGGGSVDDNCPAGSSFSMIGADTMGVCPDILITRTYVYVDFSGNSDTAQHLIYINDTIAPVIASCPPDISISETDLCDTLLVFGLPDVTDNCGEVIITNNYTNDTSSMATFSGGVTEILFTVSDGCGNSDTCSMTVTVDADPKITCPPLGTIDSESDLPTYPTLADFEMAGGSVNAFCAFDDTTFMYTASFDIDAGGCTATITETVSIADTLGNITSETKMTAARDTLNPVLVGCFDMFVPIVHETCEIDTTFFPPVATDNFGVDTTYYVIGNFVDDTAQVVYYAKDFCGNIDSCEFNLIVYDPTSPDIELDDITVMCDTMGAVPVYADVQEFLTGPGAMVYDCRLDSSSFAHDGDVVDMDGHIVRTYSIQDSTGNIGTTSQMITFMDSTDPEFVSCTDDISEDAESDACGANIMVPAPTYMDNCNGTLTLTNDFNGTDDASGFYPVGTTTVIWTIADSEGLTDTCSFDVTITDTTNPSVTCPPDTMIFCSIDNYPPFTTIAEFIAGGGEASDNCDLASISLDMDSEGNEYVRTYTIVDVNGLESTCVQDIVVFDTIAPTLVCVPMIIETTEPNTCDKFITITPPTVMDDCDTDIELTNSLTGAADPSGVYSDTTEITWYAVDDFGNVDSCTYNIIVVDGTGPVVANPDTTFIMCDDMLTAVDTFMTVQDIINAGGSATDNCGIEYVNFLSQTEVGVDTFKRVYEVVDSTGNASSITHCIVINDTTPPSFSAPADVTIDCDADENDLSLTGTIDSTMLADNCMDIDTLIYFDTVDPEICPLINQISRVWVLTDISGNETRDTQLISTIDTVPPVFDSLPSDLDNIDCDEAFPPMDLSIEATDNCSGASVLRDTLPYVVDICVGYDVTYRYIAVDGCNNRDTITQTFSVNPDDTPPSLVSTNDVTVDSYPDICGIPVDSVAGPTFEEDCSGFTLTRNYMDTIYHVGTNYVEWTATNDCGIDSTIEQVVVVEDNIIPVPLCKNATAGITSDPQNYVYATSFVEAIDENCGIDSILVMRLDQGCGITDNEFRDSILICCEDVGQSIAVMIKIVDEAGNENFCNAFLDVDDHRSPVVVEPLPNIVISCSYVFDTLDLEVFGSFTMDPDGREEIIIEDTLYAATDSVAGIDGLVSDECIVSIEDSTVVNLDICNNGYIKRIFTFTDLGGNTTTSEQLIIIQDVSPFNINGTDITWPEDYVWNQCGTPAPDTSVSGAPQFTNIDKCSQVSASYKDLLFNYPTSSCPKVRRKWKVIDWCQYDESVSPNPGLWEYNQYIFVENTVAPTILTACTDTLICAPNNECTIVANMAIEAEDDCSDDTPYITYEYTIDVHSDSNSSNDISGTGSSFSHELEMGHHVVTWYAEDRCGNVSSCSYTITARECKAPTAVCLSGLAIGLNNDGQAELWASDVNQSSFDNCTSSENLIFSFSSDTEDGVIFFDCDDVEENQYVEMWVTDEEGNQSFCSTFIDVQDNNNYCDDLTGNDDPNSLEGKIATESNTAIPEAMVSILGAEMEEEFMTEEDGEYAFGGINIENDYQVQVERDKDDMEGVNTLDLVHIQRHILGIASLNSPYKLIAADINSTESITAADLVELRKMILGLNESFPDNESWRFVSMDDEMSDMENPWPFSEDLIVGNAPIDNVQADFVGVKIGDVDNSVESVIGNSVISNRNQLALGIVTQDQKVHRDDEVLVDFVSHTDQPLSALQMTIEWDPTAMNFVDIVPVGLYIQEEFINKTRIAEGIISIAWTSVEGQQITQSLPMFQLVFEGNRSFGLSDHLKISSSLTEAIAFDTNDQEYDVELRFVEGEKDGLMLLQNRPNPFVDETIVEFVLPEDMDVTFKVFNGAGSLIYRSTQLYNAGPNTFKLNEQLKEHKGILFLKMETAEFSDVKRMIRIE